MSGGGGTNTTVTQSGPPQQFLDAYSQVYNQAQGVASTPYQPYPGQLVAPFSPMQEAGFGQIAATSGMAYPYINAAAERFGAMGGDLTGTIQPYVDEANRFWHDAAFQDLYGAYSPYAGQAQDFYNRAANIDVQGSYAPFVSGAQGYFDKAGALDVMGAASPYMQAAMRGFQSGSAPITMMEYSPEAIAKYFNPYVSNVVDATQAQFANQNAQQYSQLRGNAASQGALGNDRLGVAQGVLAGQQLMAQSPIIANLYNTGFAQAQNQFNTQQQADMLRQIQSRGFALQGAQGMAGLGNQAIQGTLGQGGLYNQAGMGYLGLGNQALQGALGQAGVLNQAGQGMYGLGNQALQAAIEKSRLYQQAAQGFGSLGQQLLAAQQGQGWLNAQAGAGFAGLGNQALGSTLQSANAMLGAGALQQQQAQQSLNIPYQQWLAAQAYPFQTTGWLSNIAQGLGGSSGGTSTQSMPGPSPVSQVAGLGLAGVGLAGATGGFGKEGWLTGLFNGGGGGGSLNDAWAVPGDQGWTVPLSARGGAIKRGFGGSIPNGSDLPVDIGVVPGIGDVPMSGFGIPDAGISPVPGAQGINVPSLSRRRSNVLSSTGTTTTTSGGGDSGFGRLLKTAGAIAAGIYGGPAGALAANALGSQVHFARGGSVPILNPDFGGTAPIVTTGAGGFGVPMLPTGGGGFGAMPSLSNYLSTVAGGAYREPPKVWQPPVRNPDMPAAPGELQKTIDERMAEERARQAELIAASGSGNESGGFAEGGSIGFPWRRPEEFDYYDMPGMEAPYDLTPPEEGPLPVPPSYVPAPPMRTAARGFAAPPPQPPPQAPEPRGFGDQEMYAPAQRESEIDGLYDRFRPSPWMPLAMAGLGMAAGRSQDPVQNIAGGAMAGLQQYASADQAAKALAARVDEARAKLAETQAWHAGTLNERRYRTDTQADTADARLAMQERLAMIRAMNSAAGSGAAGTWSYAGTDPATGKPVLLHSRTGQTRLADQDIGLKPDVAARVGAANAAEEGRRQRFEDTQDYRDKLMDLRKRGMSEADARADLRAGVELTTRDMTGKLTLDDAMKQVQAQRRSTPPATTPGGLARPQSKAEYDALPVGTPYLDPDGKKRIKGGAP